MHSEKVHASMGGCVAREQRQEIAAMTGLSMRGGDVADVLATQVKKDGTGGVEQGTRRGY